MIRAVLFDFDLTLADSSAGVLECINYALVRLGLPQAPERRILESIGLSMPATLAYVAGISDPLVVQAFTAAFVERADQVMAERTVLYEEVWSVVRALQAAGLAQGIVSSKFRYRIEGILAREQLAECFRVIVGAEDTPHHKPHPGGLLLAVSRLGYQPSEVVYVGDHPVDAEAAQQAAVSFVAVLTGLSGRGSFAAHQAIAILDNMAGLPAVLGVLPA